MKSIKYCLNDQLANLCQRAVQLEELNQKINKLLPDELASYCSVSSFNKSCLTLTTTNASWAAQLRYAIPELRDRLRQPDMYPQLSSIKVTIEIPTALAHQTKKKHPNKLTAETRETILNESQHCSYEPLRKALLHLAQEE